MSSDSVDILWVLISAVLVAFMQPGFTALEAGSTRSKNSISTAIKNTSDFLITLMAFFTIGASILLASDSNGWFGWSPLFFYENKIEDLILVLFHAMFATTAVTIISGSIAERSRFVTYLIIALMFSIIIYPAQAHWAWNENGWLAQIGFVDFAGSTVVHSVGGWAALAAIIVIGPRLGRFDKDKPEFEKSNLALSTIGVFLIWLGWIGFNGGSMLALNLDTAKVILATLIAGASAGLTGMIVSRLVYKTYQVSDILHGVLAGLVAITASAHLASPFSAMLVGALGYGAYFVGQKLLVHFKLDDAIDAIPVHLFAGVLGTLAVAWMVPDTSVWEQLGIQLQGIIAIGIFSFSITYILLKIIQKIMPLRVDHSDEILGLNISEHQSTSSMLDLAQAMSIQANSQDFTKRIMVEAHSDAALIANYYNQVTQAFNKLNEDKEALLQETIQMANYDHLTGLAKRQILVTELERNVIRLSRTPSTNALMFIDLDGFKAVNDGYGHDAGDLLLVAVAKRIQAKIRKTDLASRFGGDEFVILLEGIQDQSFAAEVAQKLIDSISEPIEIEENKTVSVGASIGLICFDEHNALHFNTLIKEADNAMYEAKRRGKGQWVAA